MYYKESYYGQKNILTNLLLDLNYLGKIESENQFTKLIHENKNCLDFISAIIKTDNMIGLNSIYCNNKFISTITFKEILESFFLDKFSKKVSEKIKSDFSRIIKQIPYNLINGYDTEINTKNYAKFIKLGNPVYRNDRDIFMVLNDISKLDNDIKISKSSNIFTNEELRNLYTITIRLIIPKYLSDKINVKHKLNILAKWDLQNGDKEIRFCSNNISGFDTSLLYNKIKTYTDNGNKNMDMLIDSTLYKVYLNLTIEELRNLIIDMTSNYEKYYNDKIFSKLYYSLLNTSIFDLIEIPTDIKNQIFLKLSNQRW